MRGAQLVARNMLPQEYGHIDTDTGADARVFTLPTQMFIDVRTREITIDLESLDARRSSRSARQDAEQEGGHCTRIALGRPGNDRGKRVFDVVLVTLAAPLWLPLLALLAVAVKCTSRGPAFYAQERIGRSGIVFRCIKLRTMKADADGHLERLLSSDPELRNEFDDRFKLRRDPRLTRFGRLLRRTGLDELPQMFAILHGEMSLVGPRPIVERETVYYGPYLPLTQSVRPGLTGLWQVSGRNDIPYPQRVACDVQYVLTRTLFSDLGLIVRTAALMFQPARRGSY
jgi:lipopolysaccharide/colanic/teichoic acid biosynthesis glycosyltransferase